MLSGGEKQRVAIARGIVNSPQYILADEPTGALDSETSKDVIDILESLNKSGSTVIIVTHNDEIANRCMRKIEIKDGRIA
jgi:putative ABC transport system ATP-binding protein